MLITCIGGPHDGEEVDASIPPSEWIYFSQNDEALFNARLDPEPVAVAPRLVRYKLRLYAPGGGVRLSEPRYVFDPPDST